jgi:hypothetical protein
VGRIRRGAHGALTHHVHLTSLPKVHMLLPSSKRLHRSAKQEPSIKMAATTGKLFDLISLLNVSHSRNNLSFILDVTKMALHEKLKQIQVIDFLVNLFSFQEREENLRTLRLLNKTKNNNLYKIT